MGWLIGIILATVMFPLFALYIVIQLVGLLLRIIFAPVVWLNGRQTRQRVTLYHYDVPPR